MAEAKITFWPHYKVIAVTEGIAFLRGVFPEAKANDLNFVLFSTSGVHGSYNTIEEAEQHLLKPTEDTFAEITFVVVQPRLVVLQYGTLEPANQDDIGFLKRLRASSWEAVTKIGAPNAS
jgi:hypothetical protein